MKPDPRVDAYIAKSAPFAQPVLRHLRRLVSRACPDATEAIKWGAPFYVHGDKILCATPAFKAHCALIFWHRGVRTLLAEDGVKVTDLRRLAKLKDLPPDRALLRYLELAAELGASGQPARPARRPRPEAQVPADLADALKKAPKAAQTFRAFAPSHRREYIEWITGAKRPETRTKRLAETLNLLGAGKPRNWQYARR